MLRKYIKWACFSCLDFQSSSWKTLLTSHRNLTKQSAPRVTKELKTALLNTSNFDHNKEYWHIIIRHISSSKVWLFDAPTHCLMHECLTWNKCMPAGARTISTISALDVRSRGLSENHESHATTDTSPNSNKCYWYCPTMCDRRNT